MKTTLFCWRSALASAAWAIFITTGCKGPEVNFSINGRDDTLPITEMPSDPNDTQHVISVMASDTVVFQDLSQPAGKVKSRQWDFNGDGVPDFEGASTSLVLEPGFYKVVLCINGTSQCMARCLYVAPLPEPDTAVAVLPEPDTLQTAESEPEPEPEPVRPKPKKNTTASTSAPKPQPTPPPAPTPRPEPAPVAPPKPKPVTQPAPIKPTAPADKPTKLDVQKGNKSDTPQSADEGHTPRTLATVGLPLSSHPATDDCLNYKQSTFSVSLQPKKWVSLQSFRVFTDGCGGVNVAVSGGDVDVQFSRGLVKGRNQVPFGDEEVLLEPGITYTLTCTAVAPYGGCNDTKTPHFEDATGCGGTSAQHAALTLNQSGKLFIYDFKFLH